MGIDPWFLLTTETSKTMPARAPVAPPRRNIYNCAPKCDRLPGLMQIGPPLQTTSAEHPHLQFTTVHRSLSSRLPLWNFQT